MTRLLILAALGFATSARAAPAATDEAAALFDDGKRHFDIGEYAAAITSWKQSYLLSSAPLLLFNLGQAYRLSGNCGQANRFYLNYKRAVAKPDNGIELEQAMAKCAGVAPATGDSDAKPALPPGAPPPEPAQAVQARSAPHPAATVTASPRLPIGDSRDSGLQTAGFVVGGVGLAAGVVAIVAGFEAASKASDVSSAPQGAMWAGSLPGDQSSGQAWQTRARVFGVLGGAALLGGGALWWLGHRAAGPHVEVAVAAGRAEVSWSCAF